MVHKKFEEIDQITFDECAVRNTVEQEEENRKAQQTNFRSRISELNCHMPFMAAVEGYQEG
ncbi:MAG: hypothetical protein QFB86_00565 [Patescibacteria group bacterium]|nr:hypothetical protein [Patescibacteria group bacterium]